MVKQNEHQLDAVFHALGDATRRQMLRSLASGERTVGQLAEPFAMSLAAASKHVKALENAGLLRREVQGRTHLCRLEPGPLASANTWLAFYQGFWNNQLDALERLLAAGPADPADPVDPQAGEPGPLTPARPRQPHASRGNAAPSTPAPTPTRRKRA